MMRGRVTGLVDRVASAGEPLILFLGRLALGAIFVPSGFEKLTHLGGFAQSLAGKGVPAAMAFAVLGAAVEFFGSLALILGIRTRITALVMIAFVIVATMLSHEFWLLHDASRNQQYINFMRNVAIIGGLLYVFARGAGGLSVDRR